MPGTPATTPNFSIPRYATGDPADFPTQWNAGVDQLDTAVMREIRTGGKCIIPTTEARTNTAYGAMTTPDQVTGVFVPTDCLLQIAYMADVQGSTGVNGYAAIFIGANQMRYATQNSASPVVQEAQILSTSGGVYTKLATGPGGLFARYGINSSGVYTQPAYTGDVTTGQLIYADQVDLRTTPPLFFAGGGWALAHVASGTYTISVQYRAVASGTVTAKNRKLWVRVVTF